MVTSDHMHSGGADTQTLPLSCTKKSRRETWFTRGLLSLAHCTQPVDTAICMTHDTKLLVSPLCCYPLKIRLH